MSCLLATMSKKPNQIKLDLVEIGFFLKSMEKWEIKKKLPNETSGDMVVNKKSQVDFIRSKQGTVYVHFQLPNETSGLLLLCYFIFNVFRGTNFGLMNYKLKRIKP